MTMTSPIAVFSTLALTAVAAGQGQGPNFSQDRGKVEHRIAWHGTWAAAKSAAAATKRPILLVFAAPHCGEVPGMW